MGVPARDPASLRRTKVTLALLAAAGAIAAAAPAFLLYFRAWPECVVVPYFIARGGVLYDDVPLQHTPFLLMSHAFLGRLFGFSAMLCRALTAASMAATGLLLVVGVRRWAKGLRAPLAGLLVAVPTFVLWIVYTDGPALWFDPFVAPFLLGAVLALERFEQNGSSRWLTLGGLVLGLAILVKQTCVWALLGAVLWLLVSSRRGGGRVAMRLAVAFSAPYAVYAMAWAIWYRTTSHLHWNILVPLTTGMAGQTRLPDAADLIEGVALLLVLPASYLLRRSLPVRLRSRSPAAWVALGACAMAWPHWGLLHVAGACGLFALVGARATLVLLHRTARLARRSGLRSALVLFATGAALLVCHLAVAWFGAGPILIDHVGGEALYWEDEKARASASAVRKRVGQGEAFLNFYTPWDTVYVLTGTTTPDGKYFNPAFWWFFRHERLDQAVVESLRRRPGTLVLFTEPAAEEEEVRASALYRYLVEATEVVEKVNAQTTWRRVR